MKKRKIISLLLVFAMAISVAAGCGTKAVSKEEQKKTPSKEKVTVHLADMSVYGIAIFNYADEIGLLDGYFDDIEGYDVTVELSEWPSGVEENTAFAAKQIDFSSMGNIPAVSGVSNGYGTKILAVNYLYDDEYLLAARKGADIKELADIKGKNVGTYVGTVTHYAIGKYLEAADLTIDDVNLLNVGAEASTSLRSGDIDVTVLGNIVAHKLEEEGEVTILSEEKVPIYNYVVGREEFVQEHPEIAVRVLELINDTWDYVLENKEDYTKFYAEVSGNDVATIEAAWSKKFPIKYAKDFNEEDYKAYTEFVDWMKDIEYIEQDIKAEDLLDLTYAKKLKK